MNVRFRWRYKGLFLIRPKDSPGGGDDPSLPHSLVSSSASRPTKGHAIAEPCVEHSRRDDGAQTVRTPTHLGTQTKGSIDGRRRALCGLGQPLPPLLDPNNQQHFVFVGLSHSPVARRTKARRCLQAAGVGVASKAMARTSTRSPTLPTHHRVPLVSNSLLNASGPGHPHHTMVSALRCGTVQTCTPHQGCISREGTSVAAVAKAVGAVTVGYKCR